MTLSYYTCLSEGLPVLEKTALSHEGAATLFLRSVAGQGLLQPLSTIILKVVERGGQARLFEGKFWIEPSFRAKPLDAKQTVEYYEKLRSARLLPKAK